MNELSKKQNHPAPESTEEDYKLIEEALLQNPRGRWFLEEFLNRNRPEDTRKLLDAIQRIENSLEVKNSQPEESLDPIRMSIIEMSRAIAKTREEIKSIKPENDEDNQLLNASEELSAIVESTESATNTILEAAEEIQEAAWILREAGADDAPCDTIDNKTTDIYTACSFQDITGQRTTKVVQALCYIENRVNAMIEIWGLDEQESAASYQASHDNGDNRADAHLLNGPAKRGEGLAQDSIDDMLNTEEENLSPEEGQSLADSLSFDSIEASPASQVDVNPDDFDFEPIEQEDFADISSAAEDDEAIAHATNEMPDELMQFEGAEPAAVAEFETADTISPDMVKVPESKEDKLDYITRRCSTQSAAMAATLISDIQFEDEQEDLTELAQLAEGALSDAPLTLPVENEEDEDEEEIDPDEELNQENPLNRDIDAPSIQSLNPADAESAELGELDENKNILDTESATKLKDLSPENLIETQEEALLS